jgi:hypothetical protein
LAGEPARAVPSTTATIMWRELALEGRNPRILMIHGGISILIIRMETDRILAFARKNVASSLEAI